VLPSNDADLMLIDVDPASPTRGELYPVVARGLWSDKYVPQHVLALAARPGFVLHPERQYAFVVRRGFGDADGNPLEVHPDLALLAADQAPDVPRGAEMAALYTPLWETLDLIGVARDDVAAATVFTTGDVIKDQLYEV